MRLPSLALALLVVLATACTSPTATGRIAGTVRWEGPIPEREMIDVSGIPEIARTRTTPLLSEEIVVNVNGTVHSALVHLESGERAPPPSEPAILVSEGGRFEPHVLAVQAGEAIEVSNAGPTIVNVHLIPAANPEENYALPSGRRKTIRIDEPEPRFIRVKCDVLPWMRAWIAVLSHRWFAVTGESGAYAIEGVPSGRHVLVLRHPRLGEQRVEVNVVAGRTTTQDFTLKLAAPPTSR